MTEHARLTFDGRRYGSNAASGAPSQATEAKHPVLGVGIDAFTFEDALGRLAVAPVEGRRVHVHFCTAHTLVEASRDAALRDLLNTADAVVAPDGMPLVWHGRLSGRTIERVCGPDVMPALIERTAGRGLRHFFYGGADGVAGRLAATFQARFPSVAVAGVYTPPFRPLTPDEDDAVVRLINAAEPDFVWVGLGSPKQEFWVAEHRGRLNAAVLLAVGAAFDFHTGAVQRAPLWMQRSGVEWLYRLTKDPRRLWRRYTIINGRFLSLLAAEALRASGNRIRRQGRSGSQP